jgi:hypothetical protein
LADAIKTREIRYASGRALPNPAQLINNGWSKKRSMEALMPGTVITVTIAPSKAGGTVGLLRKAVNDKGEELVPGGVIQK